MTPNVFPWHAGYWLGQAAVDIADRDALLADIANAEAKVPPLDDLVALSADPGRLESVLGTAEARRLLSLSSASAPLYQSVRAVKDRLGQPEPADWVVTETQRADVGQWIANVNEMYGIYLEGLRRGPVQMPPTPTPPQGPVRVPPTVEPSPPAGAGLETVLWAGAAGVALVGLIALLRR